MVCKFETFWNLPDTWYIGLPAVWIFDFLDNWDGFNGKSTILIRWFFFFNGTFVNLHTHGKTQKGRSNIQVYLETRVKVIWYIWECLGAWTTKCIGNWKKTEKPMRLSDEYSENVFFGSRTWNMIQNIIETCHHLQYTGYLLLFIYFCYVLNSETLTESLQSNLFLKSKLSKTIFQSFPGRSGCITIVALGEGVGRVNAKPLSPVTVTSTRGAPTIYKWSYCPWN